MTISRLPEALYAMMRRPDMQAISREEERALFKAMESGDPTAREKLIKANTKFAAGVARMYANRGLPWDDLFSEAVLGLARAVDRFDPPCRQQVHLLRGMVDPPRDPHGAR